MEPNTPIPPAEEPKPSIPTPPPPAPPSSRGKEKIIIGTVVSVLVALLILVVLTGDNLGDKKQSFFETAERQEYSCPQDEEHVYLCAFDAYMAANPTEELPTELLDELAEYREYYESAYLTCPTTPEAIGHCYHKLLMDEIESEIEYYEEDYADYWEEEYYAEPAYDSDQFLTYPLGGEYFCFGDTVEVSWQPEATSGDSVDVLLTTPRSTLRLDTVRTDYGYYEWEVRPIHETTTGHKGTAAIDAGDLYKIKLQTNAGTPLHESGYFEIGWCSGGYHDEYNDIIPVY